MHGYSRKYFRSIVTVSLIACQHGLSHKISTLKKHFSWFV
uniref:Uncharacterized protein n=1 Tax=Anguilla anguilla TaxID=7936 RepID=A0A0E9PL37_ANGAN